MELQATVCNWVEFLTWFSVGFVQQQGRPNAGLHCWLGSTDTWYYRICPGAARLTLQARWFCGSRGYIQLLSRTAVVASSEFAPLPRQNRTMGSMASMAC